MFLAETNLTGERPFHTRTQEEPGNDTDPAPHHTNWRRLKNIHVAWRIQDDMSEEDRRNS